MTVSIEIPYIPELLSKNRLWKVSLTSTSKKIYKTKEVKQFHANLALVLKSRIKSSFNPNKKTHVRMMVCRPDMRSDPANFLDAISDIVQAATGIDDRWYAFDIDWEVVKKPNQKIVVRVEQ